MGGLPFLLERMPAVVWGTPLTLGLLGNRLSEFSPQRGTELVPFEAGDTVQIGSFGVEAVRVNHSVRDGCGLGIHTDQGLVVHSGDFKFDQTPTESLGTDFQRLASFGAQDPLALIVDCTNAEKPGMTGSERKVGEALYSILASSPGRVIVTCFASHISRMEQVFAQSHRTGRRVAVAGRSMARNIETARALGQLDIPLGSEIPIDMVEELPPHEVTILSTGSQGEPFSALTRIAIGDHKWVRIKPGDTVVLSASMIPGNEADILRNIDSLFRQGAHVIYGESSGVHVSGHGSQEEIRLMMSLTRPRYVIPIHGDYRHLVWGRDIAVQMGIPHERVLLLEAGEAHEFANGQCKVTGTVPAGSLNVDGLGVGDVGEIVLSDRQGLAENGIVLPVVALDEETGEIVGGPEIYSRGFVYMTEAQELIEDLREQVLLCHEDALDQGPLDPEKFYDTLRGAISRYIRVQTGRRPIVVPVILPVGMVDEEVAEEE